MLSRTRGRQNISFSRLEHSMSKQGGDVEKKREMTGFLMPYNVDKTCLGNRREIHLKAQTRHFKYKKDYQNKGGNIKKKTLL